MGPELEADIRRELKDFVHQVLGELVDLCVELGFECGISAYVASHLLQHHVFFCDALEKGAWNDVKVL